MAQALREKVDEVIWGEEKDVFSPVHELAIREMRYRLFPGIIWDLQAWARSKAEEHSKIQSNIDNIILSVKKNVEDEHLSLQKLSKHHGKIAERYRAAARACND
jgi:Trm5-related predicted tRNA methylase